MQDRMEKIKLRARAKFEEEDVGRGVRPVHAKVMQSKSIEHKVIWQYLKVSTRQRCLCWIETPFQMDTDPPLHFQAGTIIKI